MSPTPMISATDMDKHYNHAEHEEACRTLWEESGIYKFDPNHTGTLFSVDTPPPYVSAAHLHVGHAMSYTQAEFIIRYRRMRGDSVFYPMGFDDNGLPTERYVEKAYGINKKKTTRAEFRQLCLEETRKGAETYEQLWRSMGLSVDWNYRYSTINDHCSRTSQKSFIDLYNKGLLYRSDEPVLWDTHFETALAQADLDTLTRKGKIHDIAFHDAEGKPLVISTTRPELIPACVGMYCHPEDDRYKHLHGKTAKVPMFDYEVPIKTSEEVDPEFGTGLMMCCTFGDGEDVRKWKLDKLDTRLIMNTDGKLNELAGKYAGLKAEEARSKIVTDLKEAGHLLETRTIEQTVSIAERSGQPVEFMTVPQWFIRLIDRKEEFLQRSNELNWHPAFMKVRLEDWINGLKYDWNISRQRFYGVPIPLWYCDGCGEVILAPESMLPVDPSETPCPIDACLSCKGTAFTGESDVMDTWMTSSTTPLINSNWADSPDVPERPKSLYPMTVRVQAFEIIRTWLFYTLIKSHFHTDSLPWRDVMISGWGLNENGKKISKRDLEKFTDKDGYNRYEPYAVVQKFGADALRYWAAGSGLGHDMRYNEKDVIRGHKLIVKLWNAARFCVMQWEDFDPNHPAPAMDERTPEDRWVLSQLNTVVAKATQALDKYDYASAREALDKFFWLIFCDDYLELVKDRFWQPQRYSEASRKSAQYTMWEALRTLLALWSPFIPFIAETLYQKIYRPYEGATSIHVGGWPEPRAGLDADIPEMDIVLAILGACRAQRTAANISQGKRLKELILHTEGLSSDKLQQLQGMENSILALSRVDELSYKADPEAQETDLEGLKVKLITEAAEPKS